jgi:hypothetical protein
VAALIEALGRALGEEEPEMAAAAAEALGEIGDSRAVDVLAEASREEDTWVRSTAAYALGRVRHPRATPPLVPLLADRYRVVRASAAGSLSALGWAPGGEADRAAHLIALERWMDALRIGRPAVDPLVRALQFEEDPIRAEAATALGRIGPPARPAIPTLVGQLPNWRVGPAAVAALTSLGWKPTSVEERTYARIASRDRQALLADWPATRQVLRADLAGDDHRKLTNAVHAAIAVGHEEIVRDLVQVTHRPLIISIAETLRNCGHPALGAAAADWAARHDAFFRQSPVGHTDTRWGAMR